MPPTSGPPSTPPCYDKIFLTGNANTLILGEEKLIIRTRQLRTLLAIVHHNSIARAAETVHVTPFAVSQQVRSLEAELGIEDNFQDRRTGAQ